MYVRCPSILLIFVELHSIMLFFALLFFFLIFFLHFRNSWGSLFFFPFIHLFYIHFIVLKKRTTYLLSRQKSLICLENDLITYDQFLNSRNTKDTYFKYVFIYLCICLYYSRFVSIFIVFFVLLHIIEILNFDFHTFVTFFFLLFYFFSTFK